MAKNEHYKTVVRYFNHRAKRDQKYITIELPANSEFNVDDRVDISISQIENDYITSTTEDDFQRLTAGNIMRQMDVGDKASFDIAQWTTVRSIASQIKEMYGSVFKVRKDKHRPENIIVTRLS